MSVNYSNNKKTNITKTVKNNKITDKKEKEKKQKK